MASKIVKCNPSGMLKKDWKEEKIRNRTAMLDDETSSVDSCHKMPQSTPVKS